ncbi:MAG: hypothetical protein AB7F88_04275 [Pyrinomonadaceae bacterium]
MNLNLSFTRSLAVMFVSATFLVSFAGAQRPDPTPVKVIVNPAKPIPVASGNNLYCAGYVQSSPIDTSNQIVGGLEEQDQFIYAQDDVVYVNMGASNGVKAGDVFAVVRPKGQVESRWTRKDDLGFLVQEVGTLEIVNVNSGVSAARIKTSCDNFLLGDLVVPASQRTSPVHQARGPLELFAAPSGKATGRLFMARDGQETVSSDQIVYIDLGAEDNLQVGDRLTVFRPLGERKIEFGPKTETLSARDEGYQSDTFRGGKFSNQAPRKSGDRAGGRIVTTKVAKEGRPSIRKIVGEMVVLNVKEKTATAVITRTVQEIHTGDWVEVQ